MTFGVSARMGYPQFGRLGRGGCCARLGWTSKTPARSARAVNIIASSRHVQTSSCSRSHLPITTPLIRFVPTIMSASQSSPAIDSKALETATDIFVFDKKGGKVRFGDIYADQKAIVVFIRAYRSHPCICWPHCF